MSSIFAVHYNQYFKIKIKSRSQNILKQQSTEKSDQKRYQNKIITTWTLRMKNVNWYRALTGTLQWPSTVKRWKGTQEVLSSRVYIYSFNRELRCNLYCGTVPFILFCQWWQLYSSRVSMTEIKVIVSHTVHFVASC